MNESQHPLANLIEGLKPKQMKVKWHTTNNNIDCGVFAMCHMETYMGQPDENWNCDLPVESNEQSVKLRRLRMRYASKILTHEINSHAERNMKLATDFIKKYDREEIKELVIAAQKGRDDRVAKS